MASVIAAEGFRIGEDEPSQPDLPLDEPVSIEIKKAELAKKRADAAKIERLNAEAEGRLLPADEVAGRIGHAGAQLRTGLDGLRREIEAQLPEDCRDAILGTFDAGIELTIRAFSDALEG